MKVLKHANLYAPSPVGVCDILIEGTKIAKIAEHIDEYDAVLDIEKIDLHGKTVTPGYLDIHEHITGGGGEMGPASRCPEAALSVILKSGITTVIGLLGTDGVTRSMENLLTKARALNEEGLTCYILSGSYGYPPTTFFGDPEKDIMLMDLVVGVKTAMSDHRSSNITGEELIRLGTLARRGGLLAGKAGVVTIHMGNGKDGLKPLFYAMERSDIPIETFLPTHIGRNFHLLEDGITFMKMGGYIDITAAVGSEENHEMAEKILYCLQKGIGEHQITISSDGYGSCPRFNERMECIGLTYSSPSCIHELIKILVTEHHIALETALRFVTENPAKLYKLNQKKGGIFVGADADLNIYDADFNIESVFAKGQAAVWETCPVLKGTFEEL